MALSERTMRIKRRAEAAWNLKQQLCGGIVRDALRFVDPERQGVDAGTNRNNHYDMVHDSTAILSSEQLANTFVAAMTPPWAPWATVVPGPGITRYVRDKRELKRIKDQLWFLSVDLLTEINLRSKFLQAMQPAYKDFQSGFGGIKTEPHSSGKGTRYTNVPSEDVALEATVDGDLDYVYHKVQYTGGELLELEHNGDVTLPADFRKLCYDRPANPHKMWNCVVPNLPKDNYVHVLVGCDTDIEFVSKEIGWNPYTFFRFSIPPRNIYGTGPRISMYHDTRFLNKIKDMAMQAAAWGTNPAFLVDDMGVISGFTAKLEPGVNVPVARGISGQNEAISQLEVNTRFDIAQFAIETTRADIRKGYYADNFGPERGKTPVAATEIIERSRVLNQAVGPTTSIVEQEGLFKILRNTINVRKMQNRLDVDVDLDSDEVGLTFLSAMAQARREAEVANLIEFYGLAAQFAQIDKSVQYRADAQFGLSKILELRGIDPEAIRTDEEVQEITDGLMRQAEDIGAAQMAQEAGQGAGPGAIQPVQ